MLVYLHAPARGYLADKLLGTRRSLVIGGIIIAARPLRAGVRYDADVLLGLLLVIVGTGFFKPNVSTNGYHHHGDRRRDAGFTIFYMGINIGAFFAPWCAAISPRATRSERGSAHGIDPARAWSWGFAAAGVGMLAGLATYLIFRDRYLHGIGLPQQSAKARARDGTP